MGILASDVNTGAMSLPNPPVMPPDRAKKVGLSTEVSQDARYCEKPRLTADKHENVKFTRFLPVPSFTGPRK